MYGPIEWPARFSTNRKILPVHHSKILVFKFINAENNHGTATKTANNADILHGVYGLWKHFTIDEIKMYLNFKILNELTIQEFTYNKKKTTYSPFPTLFYIFH